MMFCDKRANVARLVIKAKKYNLMGSLAEIRTEKELRKFYKEHNLREYYDESMQEVR